MNRSESINELATALAKAQAELRNPAFDSTNPHFKSKFASLAGVRDAITPVLVKHGLSVSQLPTNDHEGRPCVETMLLHSSGQWISSTLAVPVAKADAHGAGSAITYARRYSLMALVNVVGDEDDDGNHAVQGKQIEDAAPIKIPASLLEAARNAADEGREVFAAYWKAIDPKSRKLLAGELDDLKARTEKAAEPA